MRWWLPPQGSTFAPHIDAMFTAILIITGIAFVLVESGLVWFMIKYRARPGRKAYYTHGNVKAEYIWTAVPAVVCVAAGIAYLVMVPDDRKLAAGRSSAPDVRLAMWMMVTVFGLFILIGTTAGLVFNTMTIALPKVIDERIGSGISLVAVGGIATAVFLCGAVAQLAVGRVIEKYPAHLVFAFTGLMQFIGVVWVVYATGYALLGALAFAIAFVYAQVTVNDFVIARYTADAWRARVYAVRYFITYVISGAAITMIAFLHSRGGFDLVLTATAVIAVGFLIGTAAVALLVNGVERESRAVQPAE